MPNPPSGKFGIVCVGQVTPFLRRTSYPETSLLLQYHYFIGTFLYVVTFFIADIFF